MTRDPRPSAPFPLEEAAAVLRARIPEIPEVFLVLGSGLSGLAEGAEDEVSIPFSEIPGFPDAGVSGHAGRLVYGRIAGKRVLFQAGRFHFYEGHEADVIVGPVRLAARMGVRTLILTNAAGGISHDLKPGSILLLEDHINFLFRNPLSGPVKEGEERFPDMSAPYDPELGRLAMKLAGDLEIPLMSGVYAAVLGPCYETPAEIRMLRSAGADAGGMSTVPEAITARALGMRILAFSLITNLAAGMGETPLDHQEVLDVGREAGGRLKELILALLAQL